MISENFMYSGIATFMGSPYISLSAPEHYDVIVVGVPIDFGTSYRLGSKMAPQAIREHSQWDTVDGAVFVNLDTGEKVVANRVRIGDLGDITTYPADPIKSHEEIERVIAQVRKKAFPLIIGGDHSITYSAYLGCKEGISFQNSPSVGLLHFDAHLDTEGRYMTLPEIWHGNVFRKLIEDGHLSGQSMVTIGARGLVDARWYEFLEANGITLFSSQEVRKQGMVRILEKATNLLMRNCEYVYVTIDIDSIDVSQAPGTGTPKGGGLSVEDMIEAIRALSQLPVVGLDLVELNPQCDATGATSIIAVELLWNFLAFGFRAIQFF